MSDKTGKNWFSKHKILTVVGVLVVLIIIGAIVGAGKNNNSSTNTSNNSNSSASKSSSTTTASTPKLNQQANDGKLGFTVTSFQCGVTQIEQPDDSYEVSTAGAPYCEMNLSVKGIKTIAQTFDSDSQYVYSSNGTQYSVDNDATIDANDSGSNCMLDPTVNPGVTLTCALAYDVPASVTPTYAMLHDSAASNGVKVNLQ